MAAAPLHGITVLDLATVGPAARCTRILADYGARVVKVQAPEGVQIEPAWWAYGAGRDMERLHLNLKSEAGRQEFLNRAADADVVVESFRPGVAVRLGIGYDTLKARNPGLVYCSTTGYGQEGPHAGWAGHDLNYLAVGGFLHLAGRRADGGPALPGATIADAAAGGMHAALAILAALMRRARSGEGAYLDVAVADGVLSLMALPIEEHLATGRKPSPGHDVLTGRYACYDVYEARDGRWLAVAAIEPGFWANLCKSLGLERYIPYQRDDERQPEIRLALREAFGARDRDDWVAELAAANTCVSPVHAIEELAGDAQYRHRRAFVEARHPEHGRFRQLGAVLAGSPRRDEGEEP